MFAAVAGGGSSEPARTAEVVAERHDAERDGDDAVTDRRDLLGGGLREIHDAARDERPAVVDLHADGLPVLLVRHVHDRAERQRAVGGGDFLGPERLARGRRQPVELLPVPRRQATLASFRLSDRLGGRAGRAGCRGERKTREKEKISLKVNAARRGLLFRPGPLRASRRRRPRGPSRGSGRSRSRGTRPPAPARGR